MVSLLSISKVPSKKWRKIAAAECAAFNKVFFICSVIVSIKVGEKRYFSLGKLKSKI
jgi:hypothetical protein